MTWVFWSNHFLAVIGRSIISKVLINDTVDTDNHKKSGKEYNLLSYKKKNGLSDQWHIHNKTLFSLLNEIYIVLGNLG